MAAAVAMAAGPELRGVCAWAAHVGTPLRCANVVRPCDEEVRARRSPTQGPTPSVAIRVVGHRNWTHDPAKEVGQVRERQKERNAGQ